MSALAAPSPSAGQRAGRWLAVALLVSLGAWPLLPLLARGCAALAPLAQVLEPWFALQCERDPARTLSLAGVPLAVCARCSGIYFGLGLGALVRRPALSATRLRLWVGGATALMLVDIALERIGLHGSWSAQRVVTGALLGYPVGAGLAALLAGPAGSAPATAVQSP